MNRLQNYIVDNISGFIAAGIILGAVSYAAAYEFFLRPDHEMHYENVRGRPAMEEFYVIKNHGDPDTVFVKIDGVPVER